MDQNVGREGKPPCSSNIRRSLIFLQSSEETKARATRDNLTCILCTLDPTTTDAQKARKWSHSDLDVVRSIAVRRSGREQSRSTAESSAVPAVETMDSTRQH